MNEKIFLIEDDGDIASALKLRLHAEGFSVSHASDSATALAILDSVRPDIFLIDITLPGEDGIVLAGHMDEVMGPSRPPIIFLTASLREDLRTRAKAIERSTVMNKPFKSNELIEAIRGALAKAAHSNLAGR